MQKKSSEDRIQELEGTVASLKEQVTQLSEDLAKTRSGIQRTWGIYDSESKAFFSALMDIQERIKMIEPMVYPQLGKLLQNINEVTKPPENLQDPELPPPSKPPSTTR
jgi:hypothetical protein